ncbi:hypothetical protein MNEG_3128 [Monoraphidium neglectum]|uniref:Uncharacterized protein n=1 Tax=Monoraphidium neglectum TaxID=145388 RepID=A0A0D2MWJ5_9CHLO|nr:hypothetical protein MNEG_3128 [Monoraphidium neglectum]KIZ04832.1 hypothetical protein MNEG_3128 [Monoraphidium neglectum]|eukprot:XP_013903851.1 hypothetical protein MNEG_3128 [Monoraphidium neglectum]
MKEGLAAAPIRAPAPPRVGLVTAAPPGSHAAAPPREAGWRGAAFLSAASRAGGALAGAVLAPARAAGAAVGAAASGWGLGLGHAAAAAVPVGIRMASPQEQRQESSSQKATGGEAGAGKGLRGATGFTADKLVPRTDKDAAPEQAPGPAGRGSFVAYRSDGAADGAAAGAAGAREAAIARDRPSAAAAAVRAAAAAARALAAPLVWWVALQVSVLQSGVRTAGWLISAAVWWALLPARAALWAAAAPTRLAWHALGGSKPQGRPVQAG